MCKVKQQEGSKISRGALFARLGGVVEMTGDKNKKIETEAMPEGDPLAKMRPLLRTGATLKAYDRGQATKKHIFVSTDWASLWVKDTSSTSKTAKRLYLNKLKIVSSGYGPDHYKTGLGRSGKTSAAKEENCFFIDSTSLTNKVSVETHSKEEADDWVKALNMMFKVARNWPTLLQPPK